MPNIFNSNKKLLFSSLFLSFSFFIIGTLFFSPRNFLSSIQAQSNSLNVPVTVEEALEQNISGIDRTNEPITVGIPLPENSGITSINQLGLNGVSVGQFRVLAKWPNGNIKWVLIDTLISLKANETSKFYLTEGSGNFGGEDLATEDSNYIYINTGPAQFRIRKHNFNLFDKVVVNGKEIIKEGESEGIVVEGQRADEEQPSLYTSQLGEATVTIEENGPVRAVVKIDGVLKNSAGKRFLGYTLRMYFYKGKSKVKIVFTHKAGSRYLMENPHFNFIDLRIKPNLDQFNFKASTPFGEESGSISEQDSLRMIQGRSTAYQGYYAKTIEEGQEKGSHVLHLEEVGGENGYKLNKNGEVIINTSEEQFPDLFYLDLSNSSAKGISAGIRFAAGLWPKSIEVENGNLIIGIMPKNNPPGYYMLWGSHQTTEILYDFHSSQNNPSNEMKRFQYPLVAKAPVSWYNNAGVLDKGLRFKIVNFSEEANYYESKGIPTTGPYRTLSRTPKEFKVLREHNWGSAGGPNQYDQAFISFVNFLREDLNQNYSGTYFLKAEDKFRYYADRSVFHSDDYDASTELCVCNGWSEACSNPLAVHLSSKACYLHNFNLEMPNSDKVGSHNVVYEWEHVHWYGLPLYYYCTGDERIKEAINDFGEWYLAISYPINLQYGRPIGNFLRSMALLYYFTGDEKYLEAAYKKVDLFLAEEKQWGWLGMYWDRGYYLIGIKKDGKPVTHTLSIYRYPYDGLYWLYYVSPDNDPYKDKIRDILEGLSEFYNRETWLGPGKLYAYDYFVDDGTIAEWEQNEWPKGFYCGTFALVGGYEFTGNQKYLEQMENDLKVLDGGATFGIYYYQDHPDLQTEIYILTHSLADSPPLPVTDLTATYLGNGKVKLTWTSPGGKKYRIKYSNKSIVENLNYDPVNKTYQYDPEQYVNWWATENVLNEPEPKQKGQKEEFIIENLEPGIYYFALKSEKGPGLVSSISNVVSVYVGDYILITPSNLPDGTIGTEYNTTLTAYGGTPPYNWTSTNLPSWLSLDKSSGTLSGTPIQAGTFTFTIKVTDSSNNEDTKEFTITINEQSQPLTITTEDLPEGAIGSEYSATLTATGGTSPYTWSKISGNLPNGLSLNSSTGIISGTPTTQGTFNFTIQVKDNENNTATKSLSITINQPDTTPPTRSNGSPIGELPAGTTQITLSLTTNENATCRYSTTPNVPYSSMTNTFSNTGSTSHSTTITGLSSGNTYNYYIKCIDTSNNANTDDYTISFSIASPGEITTVVSKIKPDCTGESGLCFTSLAAWEEARQGDITASGRNTIEVAECYPMVDTTPVVIDGWKTDAEHYIKIYTPKTARHNGKWDENKYRLVPSSGDAIRIKESNIKIYGLQIHPQSGSGIYVNAYDDGVSYSNLEFAYNIIKGPGSVNYRRGIRIRASADYTVTNVKIWNNIIYDFAGTNAYGIDVSSSVDGQIFVYNNTVYNCFKGIATGHRDTIAKNNLVKCYGVNNSFVDFSGVWENDGFSHNASSDGTADDQWLRVVKLETGTATDTSANKLIDSNAKFQTNGVKPGMRVKNTTDNTWANVTSVDSETQLTLDNDIFVSGEGYEVGATYVNRTFTFVDEANDDFHLASTDDTGAKDYGTDLSSDPNLSFNDDIDGDTRSGTWDIGADERIESTYLKGDLNQDNKVNSSDFQILIQKFKETQNIEIEDLNSDGIVDIKDIGILMHYWNE